VYCTLYYRDYGPFIRNEEKAEEEREEKGKENTPSSKGRKPGSK
jgi:hypothetical protein